MDIDKACEEYLRSRNYQIFPSRSWNIKDETQIDRAKEWLATTIKDILKGQQ